MGSANLRGLMGAEIVKFKPLTKRTVLTEELKKDIIRRLKNEQATEQTNFEEKLKNKIFVRLNALSQGKYLYGRFPIKVSDHMDLDKCSRSALFIKSIDALKAYKKISMYFRSEGFETAIETYKKKKDSWTEIKLFIKGIKK